MEEGRVSLLSGALTAVCPDQTLRDQGNPRPSVVHFLLSSTQGTGKEREIIPEAGFVILFNTFILLFWCGDVCLFCVEVRMDSLFPTCGSQGENQGPCAWCASALSC